MRSFDWSSIEASGDGDFERLPAGPYVVRITAATDNPGREYVEVVFDIAEGEHYGYYSDAWGEAHPWAHHLFMSYKDSALGMLKGRLEAIQASNPGFDSFAAWDAGRLDMFVGRVVGVNLREEEYERRDGGVGTRLAVCQVVDAQKVRDGEVQARDARRLAARPSTAGGGGGAGLADVEVPFD